MNLSFISQKQTRISNSFFLNFGQSIQGTVWYKVMQTIGTGGNGVTFLVMCTDGEYKGQHFALKVFRKISSKERRIRFLAEVEFLKTTNHPSILRHYDNGVYKSFYPFVVTSFMPHTLAKVMGTHRIDSVTALMYTTQLLSALSYLQGQAEPIIHRDIKPQNIFVNGPTAILGDFGLIKVLKELSSEHDIDEDRAEINDYLGFPLYYRTPDLVSYMKGESTLTAKSDIYQLGLVIAQMFTGINPMQPPTSNDPYSDVVCNRVTVIKGKFGIRITNLINKMLDPNPNTRPSVEYLFDSFLGLLEDYGRLKTELDAKIL